MNLVFRHITFVIAKQSFNKVFSLNYKLILLFLQVRSIFKHSSPILNKLKFVINNFGNP